MQKSPDVKAETVADLAHRVVARYHRQAFLSEMRISSSHVLRRAVEVNLREVAITADKVEDVLDGMVEEVEDLEAVEKALGGSLRDLAKLMGSFEHSSDEYHNGETVLEHTKWVLEDLDKLTEGMEDERKLVLRLAALLHDVGKAYTHEVQPDGKHTFYGHAKKSVAVARALLKKHRAALGHLYQRVIDLVRLHDAFLNLVNARARTKDKKYLNSFMREALYLQGHLEDLITIIKADSRRSQVYNQTLNDIQKVLDDIVEVERQRAEEAEAKARFERAFEHKMPEILELLRQEAPYVEGAATLREINTLLGKNKRFDLIKRIKTMIGG